MISFLNIIKVFLVLVLSLSIGFGTTYFIGWFISNDANLLRWSFCGKTIYLIFSIITTQSSVEEFKK